jgi:hypothetical protein
MQNSYGLDDIRKPEFALTATAWQYQASKLLLQPHLLTKHEDIVYLD